MHLWVPGAFSNLSKHSPGLGGQCWRLGPPPPAPVTAARQRRGARMSWCPNSCGPSRAVGVSFAGGARVDPDSTWLPELLGCHPVSLAILRVLLVRGLTHPLQPVVTEEPLGGEKPEASGGAHCQLSPFPGNWWHSCSPPLQALADGAVGLWGQGSGPLPGCGLGRPLLLEPEASPCKMGVVRRSL